MKAKKFISTFTNLILVFLVIILGFIFISSKVLGKDPSIFGYQIKAVLSGSMEPEFDRGSLIAINHGGDMERFKNGDVITFLLDKKTYVTHRIIGKGREGERVFYLTKGDNNEDPDSNKVWSGQVIGEYTGLTIPYIGYLVNFAKSKEGTAAILFVPGILLIIYAIYLIKSAFKEIGNLNKKNTELEQIETIEQDSKPKRITSTDKPFKNRNYLGIRGK